MLIKLIFISICCSMIRIQAACEYSNNTIKLIFGLFTFRFLIFWPFDNSTVVRNTIPITRTCIKDWHSVSLHNHAIDHIFVGFALIN